MFKRKEPNTITEHLYQGDIIKFLTHRIDTILDNKYTLGMKAKFVISGCICNEVIQVIVQQYRTNGWKVDYTLGKKVHMLILELVIN